jgi:hypothetical protein
LIGLSPEFRRLKNPMLRATVARVATLAQVARIGNLSVADVVNALRDAAGAPKNFKQAASADGEPAGCPRPAGSPGESTLAGGPPSWFDRARIAVSFDAREMIESGRHPLPEVTRAAEELPGDRILELITPFEPAPLVDVLRGRGFDAWGERRGPRDVRVYFCRRA